MTIEMCTVYKLTEDVKNHQLLRTGSDTPSDYGDDRNNYTILHPISNIQDNFQ